MNKSLDLEDVSITAFSDSVCIEGNDTLIYISKEEAIKTAKWILENLKEDPRL